MTPILLTSTLFIRSIHTLLTTITQVGEWDTEGMTGTSPESMRAGVIGYHNGQTRETNKLDELHKLDKLDKLATLEALDKLE